jgi:hypothetical protein
MKSLLVNKFATTLTVLLVTVFLAGCVTTGTTGQPARASKADRQLSLKARCAGWQALSYEHPGDTGQTVNGILKHNEVGARKGCWPRKKK